MTSEQIAARFHYAREMQIMLPARPVQVVLDGLASTIAYDFERSEEHFDKARFLRVCGVGR